MKRIVNRVPLNEQKEVTEKAHLLHLIRSSESDSTPPKRLAQEVVVAWHHSDVTMMSLEHLAEEDVVGLRAKDGPRLARAFVAVAAFGNRVSVTQHLSAMHARKAGGRAGGPQHLARAVRRRSATQGSFGGIFLRARAGRVSLVSSLSSRLVSSRLPRERSFRPPTSPNSRRATTPRFGNVLTPDAPRRGSATS